MRQLTENEILELLQEGYSLEEINKGYGAFIGTVSDSIIENALSVKRLDAVGKFKDDFDACRQAEKDGVKFINDIKDLEKGCYIDTPANRVICTCALENNPQFKFGNWILRNPYSNRWVKYSEYVKQLQSA